MEGTAFGIEGVDWGMVVIVLLMVLVIALGFWFRGKSKPTSIPNTLRKCPLCGKPTKLRISQAGTYAQWICDNHGPKPMVVVEGQPPTGGGAIPEGPS